MEVDTAQGGVIQTVAVGASEIHQEAQSQGSDSEVADNDKVAYVSML